jgi:hypothetical protein
MYSAFPTSLEKNKIRQPMRIWARKRVRLNPKNYVVRKKICANTVPKRHLDSLFVPIQPIRTVVNMKAPRIIIPIGADDPWNVKCCELDTKNSQPPTPSIPRDTS